jgi:hypothetical protein
MPCRFSSFDELWQRYVGDPVSGPSSSYAAMLTEDQREAIRQKLRWKFYAAALMGRFR